MNDLDDAVCKPALHKWVGKTLANGIVRQMRSEKWGLSEESRRHRMRFWNCMNVNTADGVCVVSGSR